MARDHYIPVTYLRSFCIAPTMEQLRCVNKSDLSEFFPGAHNVCCVQDGSTNPYLTEPRFLETILKLVEPDWPDVLKKLDAKIVDDRMLQNVAALLVLIRLCSPTGSRLTTASSTELYKMGIRAADREGAFSPLPTQLETFGANLTDLIEKGFVEVDVDSKHAQTYGLTQLQELIDGFVQSDWEFLTCGKTNERFLTCDFPLIISKKSENAPPNQIFPLTPEVAVRVHLTKFERTIPQRIFKSNRNIFSTELSASQVRTINRYLVMGADRMIFCSTTANWFLSFWTAPRN